MSKQVVDCFGILYTAKRVCGECERFDLCGEEWADRSRCRIAHAQETYGTGVGDPSPWGENTTKENEG